MASHTSAKPASPPLGTDWLADLGELGKDQAQREFFGHFLERSELAVGCVAGAVWLLDEAGRLRPLCNLDLDRVGDLNDEQQAVPHYRLLLHVLTTSGDTTVEPLGTLVGADEAAANPTRFSIWMAPLRVSGEAAGVIEFFFEPNGHPGNQDARPLRLRQALGVAEEYLAKRSARQARASASVWARLAEFSQSVHEGLGVNDTAGRIANESRRLLECDRVSVALWRGGRCRLAAISGQDVFDRRTLSVQRLEELTSRVIKSGESLWFRGEAVNLPPQLEAAVDSYLDQSLARAVIVLPLERQPAGEPLEDDRRRLPRRAATIPWAMIPGAMIIEQFRDVRLDAGFEQRVEFLRRTSAQALGREVDQSAVFLAPLLRWIGSLWLLRHSTWARLAAAGVLALGLILTFVPADFELEGRGTLEPVGRHDIFASVEGVVDQVFVEHGDVVVPGQVVMQLRNTDVEVKFAELRGEYLSASAALRRVNTLLLAGKLTAAELDRLHGERAQWLAKQHSLQEQLGLYERKAAQLEVRTAAAGQVVTWDVRNALIHRPVERGHMLVSVADVEGAWELHIHMPEDRIGHVTRAQQQLGARALGRFHPGHVAGCHVSGDAQGDPPAGRSPT